MFTGSTDVRWSNIRAPARRVAPGEAVDGRVLGVTAAVHLPRRQGSPAEARRAPAAERPGTDHSTSVWTR